MRTRGTWYGLLLAIALTCPSAAQDLAVIVHADREARVGVEELAQIYLKRRRFWRDGERIVPVNRNAASAARDAFARAIFGGDATQLVVYWNRQYFLGTLPPATLASDEAVLLFVRHEPLAIGYVDPAIVDDSVRVVLRIAASGSIRAPNEPPSDAP